MQTYLGSRSLLWRRSQPGWSALVWFCEGWKLSVFSTWASWLPIPPSFLEGGRNAGIGVQLWGSVCVSSVMVGKSLQSRSVPQTAKPGLGEIS